MEHKIDKIRQPEHNEFGVASDKKNVPHEKGNCIHNKCYDLGRSHTKQNANTTSKSLSDCVVALLIWKKEFVSWIYFGLVERLI